MESSGHLTDNYRCNGETSSASKCVKCPEKSVLESHNATYCEKCFLTMVKGKFRSTLSRRKVFRDKDSRKSLVILDGSRESAFLFRQIEDAVKQTNFKRLMIEPSFLLLLSSLDISEVHLVAKKLPVFQQALPCTYYVVHLAAVFGNLEIDGSGGCIGLQYLSRLVEVLDSFRTTIAREEMIRLLQVRLIHKFSKSIGISKVMLSSNGDQLAHLAISQLCLGRGGMVSDMTDVVEKTPQGTVFIRPLRSISTEEIATALRLEDVEHYVLIPPVTIPTLSYYVYEARSKGSIQRCTSKFLGNLIKDGFKSTVPNILGAVSKIHTREGSRFCSLCEYSFSGEGMLCYACSNIMKDLPSFSTNILPFSV